ncbi:hypothetical protein [Streptosporangium sp. NPDC006930]|uniref:hypothetical protein n=1 Tax=unclassified Streptosporangium TaxID=2632669 RepID=UPI003422745C
MESQGVRQHLLVSRPRHLRPLRARIDRLRTGGDSLEWLALTIGQLGLDFTVREPPELIDHIRTLTARLQASTEPPLRQ